MFERLEGYRLNRFEIFNWGTFHQQVWKIEPRNHNSLLTGDIGSGKSTLVDALTILLSPRPSNQIVFNKAAGAEAQERTLRSYVLGEYKNEVDADSQRARGVTLRKVGSYSVLLGYFYNQTTNQSVTLCQVFFFRDKSGQVERLFVVSENDMSISGDFSNFDDMQQLKAKLKAKGAKVGDVLSAYVAQFRRFMGIESDRALELFYQTLSMKSVSDLTHFVRDHMLETDDSRERVETLCRGFDDLDRAHKAVVRARRQIEVLEPIVSQGMEFQGVENRWALHRQQREMLEVWRAHTAVQLEQTYQAELMVKIRKLDDKLQQMQRDSESMQAEEDGLRQSIFDHGGGRLQELEREQARLERSWQDVQTERSLFQKRIDGLRLPMPHSNEQFVDLQGAIDAHWDKMSGEEQNFDNERSDVDHQWRLIQERVVQLKADIASLEGRPSNIPRHLLELRQQMCHALGIAESRLPFIGELIQVRPQEQAWEGAIERVLHNFALSLLVEDGDYRALSEWVDHASLRGRLVYYRWGGLQRAVDLGTLSEQSLLVKLALKVDAPAYEWLIGQLFKRFDYRCCETMEEFRRSPQALTRQGQIKSGGDRHEKDDRHALHDRSRFILGWNNRSKLDALKKLLQATETEAQGIAVKISQLQERQNALKEQRIELQLLRSIRSYEKIDAQRVLQDLERIKLERHQLEAQSHKLQELQNLYRDLKVRIKQLEVKRQEVVQERADEHSARKRSEETVEQCHAILGSQLAVLLTEVLPTIESLYRDLYNEQPTRKNLGEREKSLREKLKSEIDLLAKRIDRLRESIIRRMQEYRAEFSVESKELDSSLDALPDYRKILVELEADGLPAFEARFKQELNEKAIQSVVHFQSRLERSKREIHERMTQINASLKQIDYNDGTFIELKAIPSLDGDIRLFQQDLRACLEGSLSGQLYDEQRFLKVKALIERFRGREGFMEADKRWTQRVTDVRYWFEFAASEVWRADGAVREYYESGSGKSGGQKEKLAYTVLASALAYQYGLHEDKSFDRSFRFVCIDEAFGKGSDDSTRYGLELFKKLGLQLLVVTPMQKIRIIEDYVSAVHFVHNEGGRNSMLRNLSIDEYRKERGAYQNMKQESEIDADD